VPPDAVEIVRKGVDAWNQRDADLWLSYAAPEIEWLPAGPAAVESAVYRGYEEVASGFESVWQTWEEFRFEESEVRDLDGSVLWLGRVKMKGAASHLELDQEFAIRAVLRGDKVVSVHAFLSWREALEAVGRSE
jgi:ketosteroid isomerase-like protein